MKLNDSRPTIETSGNLEEQFFSIQDQGMIFDILRNKMYSNPILAICREISCNARDAHREVGKAEVPVEIQLPTMLEPFYKIKDFGPGISPDRMSNIFIKYTASTKRDDNVQTGGFGLGAKTPFSYSDTFTIITNFEGIQYNYACFIDETKVGKLALFSSAQTSEPNGTTIIVPVKPGDFRSFTEWTEQATRHWDVKPIIKGGSISYPDFDKILEGSDWAITKSQNTWQRGEVKLIIDGIEYPLEMSTLKTYADTKLINSARGNLFLYFNVGELSLSASREQVYLDNSTQEKIKVRLEKISNDIKQIVDDKIMAISDFWSANVFYHNELRSAFSDISFLGQLYWKGTPLFLSSSIFLNCPTFSFKKGKYSRKAGTDPDRIFRYSSSGSFAFDVNSTLFINDLQIKEPNGRHVKKAFEDDPELKLAIVLCPKDAAAIDVLNNKFHLDLMNIRNLSEITKATGRQGAARNFSSRVLIFKLDPSYQFRQSSRATADDDPLPKVLCKLRKGAYGSNKEAILNSGLPLTSVGLRALQFAFPNTSFYGVDESILNSKSGDEFQDFISLEDFIKNTVLANKTINFVEIKFAKQNTYNIDGRQIKYAKEFHNLISDPNSFFLKRINLHLKIKELSDTDRGLLDIYETVNGTISNDEINKFIADNPDMVIESINTEYDKKYPLIRHLDTYRYGDMLESLSQYVNCIDSI